MHRVLWVLVCARALDRVRSEESLAVGAAGEVASLVRETGSPTVSEPLVAASARAVEPAVDAKMCANLLMAYLAGMPIPVPILSTLPQAVGLIGCCPSWVYEKVKAKVFGKQDALEVARALGLSDAEIREQQERDARDERRSLAIAQYAAAVQEHAYRNPPSHIMSAWSSVRNTWVDLVGSEGRHSEAQYPVHAQVRAVMEQNDPWLLYGRFAAAVLRPPEKLAPEQRELLLRRLVALREEYAAGEDWLPPLDTPDAPDDTLPTELRAPVGAAQVAEAAKGVDRLSTGCGAALWAKVGAARASGCGALARLTTRVVRAATLWMEAPSARELEQLLGAARLQERA